MPTTGTRLSLGGRVRRAPHPVHQHQRRTRSSTVASACAGLAGGALASSTAPHAGALGALSVAGGVVVPAVPDTPYGDDAVVLVGPRDVAGDRSVGVAYVEAVVAGPLAAVAGQHGSAGSDGPFG